MLLIIISHGLRVLHRVRGSRSLRLVEEHADAPALEWQCVGLPRGFADSEYYATCLQ